MSGGYFNLRSMMKMEQNTWQQVVDLAEIIAKKLRTDGNPHQTIVITQNHIKLVIDEKGTPLPQPEGLTPRK